MLGLLLQRGFSAASSWVPQPVGTQVELNMVRAVSSSVGWAAGRYGTVARTADGGITWHARQLATCATCPLTGFVVHDSENAVVASGGTGDSRGTRRRARRSPRRFRASASRWPREVRRPRSRPRGPSSA